MKVTGLWSYFDELCRLEPAEPCVSDIFRLSVVGTLNVDKSSGCVIRD